MMFITVVMRSKNLITGQWMISCNLVLTNACCLINIMIHLNILNHFKSKNLYDTDPNTRV